MATKKRNAFSGVDYEQLKVELDSIVDYLDTQIIEKITDEIEYKPTAKGGLAPLIVATIEDTITTLLDTIKTASELLLSMQQKDGMTPYIADKVGILADKLKEIQKYYEKTPIGQIEHRRVTYVGGKDKKGNPRSVTFIAQTQQRQITIRTRILKKVFETLPNIKQLEDLKEQINIKGNTKMPPALLILGFT